MSEFEQELQTWFAGRLPKEWFAGPPEVKEDREEILVVGTLPDVAMPEGSSAEDTHAARSAKIRQHREDTREARMDIADEAQMRYRRKVSWGASCGDVRELFTTLSIPVMTRLRLPGRAVLDTLIEAGVARSRSEALAWCVRLVEKHQSDWISELRGALTHVEKARASGPDA
jgi:hypothetical protein